MKIKKLCTYENIQLETKEGRRPSGLFSRLAKTFLCDNYDMTLIPHVGVSLKPKDTDIDSVFVIPFANIPYIVTEPEDDAKATEANGPAIRRRSRRSNKVSPTETEESAPSVEQWG